MVDLPVAAHERHAQPAGLVRLIFGFSILLLTLDFRFEKLEPVRFCLLFAATAAIILSRRWYLYFVVGYYFAYAVLVLVSSARTARAGRKSRRFCRCATSCCSA